MGKKHKDLDVWERSINLVINIYKLTETLPDIEKYGLVSQMRRSAVSIPSNIAEGSARESNKEFIRFLYIALGSLAELETQLILSFKLEFLKTETFEELDGELDEIGKMIRGLIKYRKSLL